MQKRVAAIHDISCFGKCSLTVALPVLSAAGIETPIIPTAVLSTHTGGFSGYTFRDLTDDILPVAEHWQKSDIAVDAVYTGYLGSKEQVGIVMQAVDKIRKPGGFLLVDPAMADHGKLYGGFPADFPLEMKKLCEMADIITPNITEAEMMLGMPYCEGPYTKEYINELMDGLGKMTAADIVLTGVYYDDKTLGAVCQKDGVRTFVASERISAFYHGTGDLFASSLMGALMNGKTLIESVEIAVDFTCVCIRRTFDMHPEMTYAVAFEDEIPYYLKKLGRC